MKKFLASVLVAVLAFGALAEPVLARDFGRHGHHHRHHGGGNDVLKVVVGVAALGLVAHALTSPPDHGNVVVYQQAPAPQCKDQFVGYLYDGRSIFQRYCWNPYAGRWDPV